MSDEQNRGASLRETGSRASTEPPSAGRLGPSGFDPARSDWNRAFHIAMLTLNFSLHHRACAEQLFADDLNNRAGHLSTYMAARVIAATLAAHQAILLERLSAVTFLRDEADLSRRAQAKASADHPDNLYRMGEKDALLLAALGIENRHHICRDSDGSGEAGETGTGSTEGDSAGPKDIAHPTPSPKE